MNRFGLVGVGRWGRRYIDAIGRRTDCRVAAMARRSQAEVDPPLPGVRVCATWQELVDDVTRGELDGLIVATAPDSHAEVAARCVATGVPALVEKPLGLNAERAEEVLRLARPEGPNPPLMVDFIHLWAPAFRELKKRIHADPTDAISHIETCGENRGPFRSWSPIYDYGPHDVAMCLDLVGRGAAWTIGGTRWIKRPPTTEGSLLEADLTLDGVSVSMRVGNEADTKTRRLAVSMKSGRTLVYDDLQPPHGKLTDAGAPVAIDPAPALDGVISQFCGQIAAWRRRQLPRAAAVEWLELSVTVGRILDALVRA